MADLTGGQRSEGVVGVTGKARSPPRCREDLRKALPVSWNTGMPCLFPFSQGMTFNTELSVSHQALPQEFQEALADFGSQCPLWHTR